MKAAVLDAFGEPSEAPRDPEAPGRDAKVLLEMG